MFFVNIDGPNGVGKSTLVEELVNVIHIKHPELRVYVQHFHRRDTLIGQTIQKVLNGESVIDNYALQNLYATDRLDFTRHKYIDLEDSYDILISDRYNTSALAYGYSQSLDIKMLQDFDKYCVKPHMNIILTATVQTLMSRLQTAKLNEGEISDIFEQQDKLEKIIAGFTNLPNLIPNCSIINVNTGIYGYIDEISDMILGGYYND